MITSTSNTLIKRIRKLEQKKFRLKENCGFVEGFRGALTAAEYANHLIEKVVVAPDLLTKDQAITRLHELVNDDLIVEVSADVFRSLSDRDNPVGMGAVVRSPLVQIETIPQPKSNSLYVILDRAGDPGNLGTIIRTADAAGATAVILVGHSVDPMHPSALKASLGTIFTIPICHVSVAELAEWKSIADISFIGTSAKAEKNYRQIMQLAPTGLLLGNEREGLSAKLTSLADETVSIPMAGQASSLNLAVAAGILMFQLQSKF
ncbi:MAG: TrmH family RNA methyltransferase [Anaerolineae bacterium]